MSNPDFPGSSWQDRPGYPDEPPGNGGGYRNGGGYGDGAYERGGYDPGGYERAGHDRGGYDRGGDQGGGYDERDGRFEGRDTYRGGRDTGRGRDGRDGQRGGGPGYRAGSYESYDRYAEDATGGAGDASDDYDTGGRHGRGGANGNGRARGYDETGGYGRNRTAIRGRARDDFERPGGPRRPGGPGGRRPGQASRQRWPWQAGWWKHWTWRKAGLLTGGIAGVTALAMIGGFFAIYTAVGVPVKLLSGQVLQSSTVYFSDNKTEVGCFCSSTSTSNVLTEAQVAQSTNLVEAVMAAEDRSFKTEGGISISGLLRAMKSTITGSGIQGGSTITEQLVKTVYDAQGNLTYKQKIEEIIVAIKLAKLKSKSWILTHYLNDIYLGSGANGAGDAAQIYFGVPAWQLNVAQAAMIAAMIQAPGAFDPYNPHAVVHYLGYSLYDRWHNEVLPNLVRDGVITQAQADATQFPAVRKPTSTASLAWSGYRGYIMAEVQNELESRYGYADFNKISGAGLRIVTTFNKAKMDALYYEISQAKQMMGGLPNWARVGAILEDPRTGGIEAMYGGPGYNLPGAQCTVFDCKYNMATEARNQVGSSFKPYVLATAVSQYMNVETSKLNGTSPLCVPQDNSSAERALLSVPMKGAGCPPGMGKVTKDNATKNGPISVALATAASSNPAFVDLAHFVGTENVVKMAELFGVNADRAGLTSMIHQTGIALGIGSLTVKEQASTFATLANGGVYITPHVIAQLDKDGQSVPLNLVTRQVLTPIEAEAVNWALSFDTNSGAGSPGTGTNAILSPYRPTIAKTGTTDLYQGAYFIGALPTEYSFAVGMFTKTPSDHSKSLDVLPYAGGWQGGYGGAWPATIWRLYMSQVLTLDGNPAIVSIPTPQLDPTLFATWIRADALQGKQKCPKAGKGGGAPPPTSPPGGPSQPPCPSTSASASATATATPTGSATATATPTATPTPTLPTPSSTSPSL